MANIELYGRVNSINVAGYTLADMQGTPAIPSATPFREGHIPSFSVVSVNGTIGKDPAVLQDRLVKISPIHGRSYELRFGNTDRIYWTDDYGNVFSTLTTKGNNLNQPILVKYPAAPSGYTVFGLQDSDAMVRVLRASELLRANHIPTEMIVRVIEPLELPYYGQLISQEELKGQLLAEVWNQSPKQNPQARGIVKSDIADLSVMLDKTTFYITVRGLQVSERLQDLTLVNTKGEFLTIVKRAFSYVNMVEGIKAKKDPLYTPALFNADNEEDLAKYFLDYLPNSLATSLGHMHRLGLAHIFPHYGNISTVGSLYDLDSVRGEPLGIGDQQITALDIKNDIIISLYGYGAKGDDGLLYFLNTLQEKGSVQFKSGYTDIAEEAFYKKYCQERGWEDNLLESLPAILAFYEVNTANKVSANLIAYYSARLAEQLGWDYVYPENDPQLVEGYFANEFKRIYQDIQRIKTKETSTTRIERFRNLGPLYKIVEWDIRCKFSPQLQKIAESYGEEIADAVVIMYTFKNEQKAAEQMKYPDDTQLIYRFIQQIDETQSKYRVAQQVIKDQGWEVDLVLHLGEIYKLFENFAPLDSREYFNYYLALLTQQLGFDFPFDEKDAEVVFQAYLADEKEELEKILKEALQKAAPGEDLEAVAAKAYLEAGYSQDTDFPIDQWAAFIPNFIYLMIDENCGEKIKKYIEARCTDQSQKEDIYGAICYMFEYKAELLLRDMRDTGEEEKWLTRINQMELEVITSFST